MTFDVIPLKDHHKCELLLSCCSYCCSNCCCWSPDERQFEIARTLAQPWRLVQGWLVTLAITHFFLLLLLLLFLALLMLLPLPPPPLPLEQKTTTTPTKKWILAEECSWRGKDGQSARACQGKQWEKPNGEKETRENPWTRVLHLAGPFVLLCRLPKAAGQDRGDHQETMCLPGKRDQSNKSTTTKTRDDDVQAWIFQDVDTEEASSWSHFTHNRADSQTFLHTEKSQLRVRAFAAAGASN